MSNGRAVRIPRKPPYGGKDEHYVVVDAGTRPRSRFSHLEHKYGIAHASPLAILLRRDNLMIFLSLVLLAGFFVQGMYIYKMRTKGGRGRYLRMYPHTLHQWLPHTHPLPAQQPSLAAVWRQPI